MKSIPLSIRVVMFKVCIALIFPLVVLFASKQDKRIYTNELFLPIKEYKSI